MSKSRLVLRHVLCGALLGVVCLFAPLEANAACSGSNISATWQFYFKLVTVTNGAWMKCKVKVNSGVVASGTKCLYRDPGQTISTSTTGGSLSVGSNCAVKGNILVGGCDLVLQGATMSKDHLKIAGVGSDCTTLGSEVFDFLAVKR